MKRIILYSCGAIKWYMKKIHSELMKQIHLKTISGLINVLQSLQNVGSVRYHFQLPGGMCHCSFNLWLPATLPSNRRKNKKGWEKGKHSSYFIKSVGNQKAINAEHDFAIFYPLTQKLKDWDLVIWILNINSVWVKLAAAVCTFKNESTRVCKSALALILRQSWLFITNFWTFEECKHTVLLIKSHNSAKKQLF